MVFRAIISQLWLTLFLGTLSSLSIYWILRKDERPVAPQRSSVSEDTMQRLSVDMQAMFAAMRDWETLCRQPMESLLHGGPRLAGQGLTLRDAPPPTFGQLERDALYRCQNKISEGRFCFYTEDAEGRAERLFEVHLEFRQGRRQLSCQELNPPPPGTELMAFYTAYSGPASELPLRFSTGLRLLPIAFRR